MEIEDDLGILRKKTRRTMSIKMFKRIKIVLAALIPLIYFIYSPLLLPLFLCYVALYFIARSIEKSVNKNLRKEYYINIPKFDSVLAFIAIIITVAGIMLSLFATTMKGGMFEGKSDEQIRAEMEERGMSDSAIDNMLERMAKRPMNNSRKNILIKNAFTMLSGERIFFEEQGGMGRDRGFPRDGMVSGDSQSEDFVPPEGEIRPERSNMMDFANNIPFDRIFSQIASSVNTVIVFLVSLSGLLTIYLMKRL